MNRFRQAISLILLAAAAASLLTSCDTHEHSYRQTVVPPTCQSIGYTINTCSCGESYYSDYQATVAHTFGDWIAGQEATLTAGGEEYCVCQVCGRLQTRDTENRSVLPKLYLTNVSGESQAANLLYSAGKTLQFSSQALLTVCSTGVKPDFDLQLITDEETKASNPVDLGWGEQSHYRLSSLLPDRTMARDASAKALWQACLAEHTEGLAAAWPVKTLQNARLLVQVYRDSEYLGLYALLPPETDWAYALTDEQISPSAALRAMDAGAGCSFQSAPTYTDARGALTLYPDINHDNPHAADPYSGLAFLYSSTESTDWASSSFSAFSNFVRHAQDQAFRDRLSQYTDPAVLLDYFLLSLFFGCADGDTVGTIWYTGDGIHWLPSFSALDSCYCTTAEGGTETHPEDIPLPDEDPGRLSYAGTNLLWKRLTEVYTQELRERYAALRKTLLQPDAVYETFLRYYQDAEAELYLAEHALYPSLSFTEKEAEQLQSVFQNRIDAMDRWIGYSAT